MRACDAQQMAAVQHARSGRLYPRVCGLTWAVGRVGWFPGLDGKDRGPGVRERETKLSIAEQVDAVVKQAVSVDNLCMMYEGFSSWV